ncbi:hypothetical protein MTO96_039783 [Rhipicephalus appendiculatus]
MGYGVLSPAGKGAIPLKFELLPQWLKRLGYSTHMVGKPLFLYLSHVAVHASFGAKKPEAPQEIVDKYAYITAYNRSVFAATTVVGPSMAQHPPNTGNNWPLRGSKGDMWEGGMRTPAVFWYGRMSSSQPRRPSQQLMHIVDWAPTLYAGAGGDVSDLGDVDGRNLWETLTAFEDVWHEDLVLQIEDPNQAAAIISGRQGINL